MRHLFTRSLALVCLLACSGGGDGAGHDASPADAPTASVDAAPDAPTDAAFDAATCGPAPIECDRAVAQASECPTHEQLCRPCTFGAYDCCVCEDSGTGPRWRAIVIDCFDMCDAGTP